MPPKRTGARASHMKDDTGRPSHARNRAKRGGDLSTGAVKMTPALKTGRVSKATADAANRSAERHASRGGGPRRRHKAAGVAAIVAALVVAVVAVATFVVPRFFGPSAADPDAPAAGTEVDVVIPEGAGATEIATLLEDEGVISGTGEFLQEVDRQDAESSMKSGSYTFVAGDDVAHLVSLLVSGPNNAEGRLTIPEGYTVSQVAAAAESTLHVSAEDFAAQAKASAYADDYPFLADAAAGGYDSLEGFLFPKTYDFTGREPTADDVIRAMLDQYRAELASYDLAAYEEALSSRYGLTLSDYDLLIVASIIEKETNTPGADGAHVASVIYNRLAAGTILQCDSTSVYANGGTLTAEIVTADWDNPYNTYRNAGLPPTPICSPSIEAVNAALNPDDTDDLYFYISGDYHVFSETYEQHEQAIADAPGASE